MDTGQEQSENEWKSFLKILLMIENLTEICQESVNLL